MILGIGTDIIEVARIKKAIEKEAFVNKIFSVREIAHCLQSKKEESFAARFAAKEAFFKALGTGWRDGIGFHEVEILNEENGKPYVQLSGIALQKFTNFGGKFIHISLSHIKETAIAYIILES